MMLSTAAEARTDQEQELLATSYDTGDVEELRSILATGVDINVKSSVGRTALHHTCLKGYAEAAQLLLGKGADVEATSDGGWTALMLASFAGHTAIARALLEKGAAIERVNVIGKSALDYARQASRSEVVKLLEAADEVVLVPGGCKWKTLNSLGRSEVGSWADAASCQEAQAALRVA